MVIPGVPHHVTQRGKNRQPVFFRPDGCRVRKRRHNGYSYMTQPRAQLKAMIARGGEIKCR